MTGWFNPKKEKRRKKSSQGQKEVAGEDSMLRRVHPKKRSVSWVNSVLRQFLPNGSSFRNNYSRKKYLTAAVCSLCGGAPVPESNNLVTDRNLNVGQNVMSRKRPLAQATSSVNFVIRPETDFGAGGSRK